MTQYLTVKKYAEERGLSEWTVYRLVDREEIAFERFGRAIRIIVRTDSRGPEFPRWEGRDR